MNWHSGWGVWCVLCWGLLLASSGCDEDDVTANPGNEQCEYDSNAMLPERYRDMVLADCDTLPAGPLPRGECQWSTRPCQAVHTRECVVGQEPKADCSPCDAWVCDCVEGRYSCWLDGPGASGCDVPEGERPPHGANCGIEDLRSCEDLSSAWQEVLEQHGSCQEGDECEDMGDWDCDGKPDLVVFPRASEVSRANEVIEASGCPVDCNPWERERVEAACIEGRCQVVP